MLRESFTSLLVQVRACRLCADFLSHGVRPVVQMRRHAHVLIAGQDADRKVHASGVPCDDASGERLRESLGVRRDEFYDVRQFALIPKGFCRLRFVPLTVREMLLFPLYQHDIISTTSGVSYQASRWIACESTRKVEPGGRTGTDLVWALKPIQGTGDLGPPRGTLRRCQV